MEIKLKRHIQNSLFIAVLVLSANTFADELYKLNQSLTLRKSGQNAELINSEGVVASTIENFPFSSRSSSYERLSVSPDQKTLIAADRNNSMMTVYDISDISRPQLILKDIRMNHFFDNRQSFYRPGRIVFSPDSSKVAITDHNETLVFDTYNLRQVAVGNEDLLRALYSRISVTVGYSSCSGCFELHGVDNKGLVSFVDRFPDDKYKSYITVKERTFSKNVTDLE